jgi:hypothetical protein
MWRCSLSYNRFIHLEGNVKINPLEAHDRYKHLMQDQWETVAKGAEECLKTNPISTAIQMRCPYVYLFAHPRLSDDGLHTRLLWQPRISRPKPQTNSYLFRGISKTDKIEICWLLPPREMWSQYEKGKVAESDLTAWSIDQFEHNRKLLEMDHPEDLPDDKGKWIYKEVLRSLRFEKI